MCSESKCGSEQVKKWSLSLVSKDNREGEFCRWSGMSKGLEVSENMECLENSSSSPNLEVRKTEDGCWVISLYWRTISIIGTLSLSSRSHQRLFNPQWHDIFIFWKNHWDCRIEEGLEGAKTKSNLTIKRLFQWPKEEKMRALIRAVVMEEKRSDVCEIWKIELF